jgi:aminopeptidase N
MRHGRTASGTKGLRAFLGVIVAASLLLAFPGGAAAQSAPPACAGAPGVGDAYYPTYGNGGYDVGRYVLDVDYTPSSDQLEGVAEIRATATQKLCRFNLDLVGLNVRRVEVDGERARFEREGNHELVITPDDDLRNGERFVVEVAYAGVPTEFTIPGFPIRTGFMATPEGATVAGQPEVAAGWFPVNDHPLDKAAYTFHVTVPNAYEVAANGFLRDRDRDGKVTEWTWRANEPMASYLATIDIGQWDVHRSTQAGLPVYDAIATQITGGLRAEIEDSFARQGEITELLESWFGPYPFSTTGGIVPNQEDLRFALETQTRPVYSKRFWITPSTGQPRDADWVVVHELAHQWAGDDIALARWQDIWLNEGFASWAEWVWEEHLGNATTQEILEATYESIPADDPFWDVPIGEPAIADLFSDPVYVRGAMTVQALLNEVGEPAFRQILLSWFGQFGGHGTTPEFIALAERISGQQLDDFFDVWLFTAEKPPPEAIEPPAAAATRSAQSAEADADASFRDEVRERLGIGPY